MLGILYNLTKGSRTPVEYCPFPLAGEGGTLNCAPSADAVAGNGGDEGRRGRESTRTGFPSDYLADILGRHHSREEQNMAQMTGGEAVLQALRHEGVEVVFGLPGVQIMGIYDAFYARSDIRIMTVRHEQTTAYMADGYARVTGKPGVALVVPGPGIQNASAALGTAYAASSPVLLLAGQVESYNIGSDRGALHEINDQIDVIRPITKWCQRVNDVPSIPGAIHEAMRQMRTGRPRPTEVEIAPDTLAAIADVTFPPAATPPPAPLDWDQVRRAAALLRDATKPLIWAGGGAVLADASRELIALAEALGAPVATTAEGKGAFPEDHRLALGVGFYGHGTSSWAAPQADVVLAVGTRLTGQMVGLNAVHVPQRLIHLDIDPTVMGKNYPADVRLVTDARTGLQALLEEVRRQDPPAPRWADAELQDMWRSQEHWLQEKAPDQCCALAQHAARAPRGCRASEWHHQHGVLGTFCLPLPAATHLSHVFLLCDPGF